MLWGTINTLQLIVLATLFNLDFPYPALFTFKLIAQITRFSLVPVDKIINWMFKFTDSTPITDNFIAMGYDTNNILQTLDTILAFLAGLLIMMTFSTLLSFFIKQCPRYEKLFLNRI
jgi:hypothetical protein